MNYKIIDELSLYTQGAIITVKDRYLSANTKKFIDTIKLEKNL